MNKFFERRNTTLLIADVDQNDITIYKNLVITEMSKMGANEDEIRLIQDATIRNSIKNHRKPEDVAWAILQ